MVWTIPRKEREGSVSTMNFDPSVLRLTLTPMGIALEEALKALAAKNGNQPGPWLDEVQD
jgi:hypothetical protein